LGETEELDQIAHAELAGDQYIQHPEPGGIGEAAEEKVQIGDRLGRGGDVCRWQSGQIR
jgi:hypothetical protein